MRAGTGVLALALTWVMAGAGAASADAPAPQPFVATYQVSYRGIGAGTLTFRFSRDSATGQYTFETRADPNLLARFFISSAALERSVLEIGPQGVRPLEWQLEDGKSGKGGDGNLHFDWAGGTATGEIEGEAVDLMLEPGLQDRSSIQIAVSTLLLRGAEPGTIPLIDDNRIKHYAYTSKGDAVLDSKLGKLEAIVYESTRKGSDRVSRFWLVPSLDYLPARAEQVRKGKVETVMELVKVERKEGG